MKRLFVVVVALTTTLGMLPASAGAPLSFTFDGAGWGHGVGLSQWGARGQALENPAKPGEDIAAYYYPGSEPGNLLDLALENDLLHTMETPIWVNLAKEVTVLEFEPIGGAVDLCLVDGGGSCLTPGPPQAGELWEIRRLSVGVCGAFKAGIQQGPSGTCRASVAWPDATGIKLKDLTRTEKICADGSSSACEYHHGELKVRDDPFEVGFHVVLAIGLDDYIKGIRELPDDWTSDGVNEAQAVAARSYAAYKFFANEDKSLRPGDPNADPGLSSSRKDACWCHLYDNSSDMQYTGWDKEKDAPHWAVAVDATSDRVLTYGGANTQSGVIQAFFSASSGGWTNSNVLGFGTEWDGVPPGNPQWPYLTSVIDPWSTDPQWGNPNASWSKEINASTIAGLLGWDEVTDATLIVGPPEPTVKFDGVDGGSTVSTTVAGRWLRITLDLQSSMVSAIDGQGAGPPPVFDDVAGSPHEEAILVIHAAGITFGCDSNSYCPSDFVTRAQMASFIARAIPLGAAGGDYFSDDDGSAHEDSINSMFEAEITVGCGGTNYCPSDHVLRAQMAAFLFRSLNLTTVSGDYFSDDDGSLFEDEINAIAEEEITFGCGGENFCPNDFVSRGQMASFLYRAFVQE